MTTLMDAQYIPCHQIKIMFFPPSGRGNLPSSVNFPCPLAQSAVKNPVVPL
jgi:hypothetical protein